MISDLTKKNWERLNSNINEKLKSRANKTKSDKMIVPTEYFRYNENIKKVKKIVELIKKNNIDIGDSIYNICLKLINKFCNITNNNILEFIYEYGKKYKKYDLFEKLDIPYNEKDILGIIYQILMKEGEKNIKGSYYTPDLITISMTEKLSFEKNEKFLDMCCGSGAYLLSLNCKNPENIFGVDIDEIAVMICKLNLIIKYKYMDFSPNIYNINYLEIFKKNKDKLNELENKILNLKFDYIVTNPPWGNKCSKELMPDNMKIKETFSAFLVRGYSQLKEKGKIKLLIPDAILNVKQHKEIRKYMLDNCFINSIKFYKLKFRNVVTDFIDIDISKKGKTDKIKIIDKNDEYYIKVNDILKNKDYIFSKINEKELKIIEKIEEKRKYSLKDSIFAIGIVTGDNKNKIYSKNIEGTEKIYTGKEILPYILKETNKYIFYDRKNLQQVAPDNIYRKNEKLVYKFINKNLCFAYDNSKSLFLNSANILIPNIKDMNIKVVLAILNSNVMKFYYLKVFGSVKLLKNSLCSLPIPDLDDYQKNYIEKNINEILNLKINDNELQKYIYNFYGFTQKDIEYIENNI